jgi:hypothetical protein
MDFFPLILTAEDESGGNTHVAEEGGTIAIFKSYYKVLKLVQSDE